MLLSHASLLLILYGTAVSRVVPTRQMRFPEISQFDGFKGCELQPSAFLSRMLRYGQASPCCLVTAMVYLERMNSRLPALCLTTFNIQRLLLTLVMLASKYLDDYYCSNKHWAAIGDLQLQELNKLEVDVLLILDFRLNLTRETYNRVDSQLEQIDLKTFRASMQHVYTQHSTSMQPSQPRSQDICCARPTTAENTVLVIKAAVAEAQAASQVRLQAAEATELVPSEAAGEEVHTVGSDAIPKGPSPWRDDSDLSRNDGRPAPIAPTSHQTFGKSPTEISISIAVVGRVTPSGANKRQTNAAKSSNQRYAFLYDVPTDKQGGMQHSREFHRGEKTYYQTPLHVMTEARSGMAPLEAALQVRVPAQSKPPGHEYTVFRASPLLHPAPSQMERQPINSRSSRGRDCGTPGRPVAHHDNLSQPWRLTVIQSGFEATHTNAHCTPQTAVPHRYPQLDAGSSVPVNYPRWKGQAHHQ